MPHCEFTLGENMERININLMCYVYVKKVINKQHYKLIFKSAEYQYRLFSFNNASESFLSNRFFLQV